MVTPNRPNLSGSPDVSDDALIALAADGDFDARRRLATRLCKLRWLGHSDEATNLLQKANASVRSFETQPEIVRETD
jgi:hypothetical protein